MSAALGIFPQGLKNEFDSAVVNEPSVFEPLKFYCISPHTEFQVVTIKGIPKCTFHKNLKDISPHTKFQDATMIGTLKSTSYKNLSLSLTGSRTYLRNNVQTYA